MKNISFFFTQNINSDITNHECRYYFINITVFSDTRRAAETDDIHDSINYRSIAKLALAHAETVLDQVRSALPETGKPEFGGELLG